MDNHSSMTMTNQTQTMPVVEYDIYSPYQYPWMSFNFLLAYWLAAWIAYTVHRLKSPQFRTLDEAKRRNVVTYILQLLATTLALFYQIYGGIDLLFKGQDTTTQERIEACVVALNVICSLYVWELIYRVDIGLPLLLHHIVTILLIQIGYCSFFDTGSLWYFRYGLLLCFHATTEQFSFIALYCYRLEIWKRRQRLLFRMAALQAVVIKTLVTGALVAYFVLGIQEDRFRGSSWGTFWLVAFPPLLLILYVVQLYSAYILITIGRRCNKTASDAESMKETVETTSDKEQPEPCALLNEETIDISVKV